LAGTRNSGRKPKVNDPNAARREQRQRAVNAQSNNSEFENIKSAPSRLNQQSKTLYTHIVRELGKRGVLKDLDSTLLEEYVTQVVVSRSARKVIDKHGVVIIDDDGNIKKNPAVDVLNNAVKNIKSLGSSLGLDPVSRSAMLSDVPIDDSDSAKNVMAMFGGV
jgi:P27 family predicted phage terminase small subunit